MKNIILIIAFSFFLLLSCEDDNPVNTKETVEITSISPSYGIVNQLVSIHGKGFGYDEEKIKVFMGETECSILDLTDTLIHIKVPQIPRSNYKVYISFNGEEYFSKIDFQVIEPNEPIIEDYYPKFGKTNDTLYIFGKFFGNNMELVDIFFGDLSYKISTINDSLVIATIPNISPGTYSLKLKINSNIISICDTYQVLNPALQKVFIINDFFPKRCEKYDTISINVFSLGIIENELNILINNLKSEIIYFSDSLVKIIPNPNINSGFYKISAESQDIKTIFEKTELEISQAFDEIDSVCCILKNFTVNSLIEKSYYDVISNTGYDTSYTETNFFSKPYNFSLKNGRFKNYSDNNHVNFRGTDLDGFPNIVEMELDSINKKMLNISISKLILNGWKDMQNYSYFAFTFKIDFLKYQKDNDGNLVAEIQTKDLESNHYSFNEIFKATIKGNYYKGNDFKNSQIIGTTDSSEIIIKLIYHK